VCGGGGGSGSLLSLITPPPTLPIPPPSPGCQSARDRRQVEPVPGGLGLQHGGGAGGGGGRPWDGADRRGPVCGAAGGKVKLLFAGSRWYCVLHTEYLILLAWITVHVYIRCE